MKQFVDENNYPLFDGVYNLKPKPMSKVLDKVISDLEDREILGINKYGTTCDRADYELVDWLQEAYEETLDKAMYLQAAIRKLQENNQVY
jgi:hypothetical protein